MDKAILSKQISFIEMIEWVVAVSLALLGVKVFSSNIVVGLLVLTMSVVILPLTGKYLKERFGISTNRFVKYLVASVLMLLATIVIISNAPTQQQSIEAPRNNERQMQAVAAAKNIISLYLKSPASAQFTNIVVKDEKVIPNLLSNKENEIVNNFVAFGDVDSQNSFGALLRNHYFLELRYQGGSADDVKNWQVNRLELGDHVLISDGKVLNPEIPMSEIMISSTSKLENMYKASDVIADLKKLRDKESITEEEFQQKIKQLIEM